MGERSWDQSSGPTLPTDGTMVHSLQDVEDSDYALALKNDFAQSLYPETLSGQTTISRENHDPLWCCRSPSACAVLRETDIV